MLIGLCRIVPTARALGVNPGPPGFAGWMIAVRTPEASKWLDDGWIAFLRHMGYCTGPLGVAVRHWLPIQLD